MAKKRKIDVEPPRPTSWTVQGQEYKVGDVIRVSTPELGLIETAVSPSSYAFGFGSVMLNLGWIKTPLPCIGTSGGFNALLSFDIISTGQLHMVYFCNCRRNAHPTDLFWRNVNLINGIIHSEGIGINYHQANNHPLVKGYQLPTPQPISLPSTTTVEIKPGTQFSLFN